MSVGGESVLSVDNRDMDLNWREWGWSVLRSRNVVSHRNWWRVARAPLWKWNSTRTEQGWTLSGKSASRHLFPCDVGSSRVYHYQSCDPFSKLHTNNDRASFMVGLKVHWKPALPYGSRPKDDTQTRRYWQAHRHASFPVPVSAGCTSLRIQGEYIRSYHRQDAKL